MTTEDSLGPSGAGDSGCKSENKPENLKVDNASAPPIPDGMSSQRVFKKVSPNQKLTLYLASRDLVVSQGGIDKLTGVLLVDPEFVENRKVYGQVTLTFRYGREDEEVMGLKFCNEAIMCLAQLYPPHPGCPEVISPLQEALLKRLGPNAYPFNMEITPLAPPSVQLVPAKEYNGAPIGTSYDIRAYVADRSDEKLHRRSTVRMGIRVVQRAFAPPSPHLYVPGGPGRTCRERAKQNRKALLFGCKSAPLDIKYGVNETAITRSAETVAKDESKTHRRESTTEPSWSPDIKEKLARLETSRAQDSAVSPGSTSPHSQVSPGHRRHSSGVSNNSVEKPITNGIDDGQFHEERHTDQKVIVTGATPVEEDKEIAEINGENVGHCTGHGGHDENYDQYRNLCGSKRPSLAAYLAGVPPPRAVAEKFYLLSDGKITLTASLNKGIYAHGEDVRISVQIRNNSNKTIKRLKIFVVQHVDVCMFSNGKFKNVVSMLNPKEDCPIHSGGSLDKMYTLLPMKGTTKNWIALEESYTKSGTSLASTVTSTQAFSQLNNPDDRNVFAIYVSYYVKVKLVVSMMGGEVSLKLPFTLMHTCDDLEHNSETLTRAVAQVQPPADIQLELKTPPSSMTAIPGDVKAAPGAEEVVKPEKDGT